MMWGEDEEFFERAVFSLRTQKRTENFQKEVTSVRIYSILANPAPALSTKFI